MDISANPTGIMSLIQKINTGETDKTRGSGLRMPSQVSDAQEVSRTETAVMKTLEGVKTSYDALDALFRKFTDSQLKLSRSTLDAQKVYFEKTSKSFATMVRSLDMLNNKMSGLRRAIRSRNSIEPNPEKAVDTTPIEKTPETKADIKEPEIAETDVKTVEVENQLKEIRQESQANTQEIVKAVEAASSADETQKLMHVIGDSNNSMLTEQKVITAQLQENENSIEDASKGQIAVLDDIDETLQDTMQFLEENTKELTKMVGEKTTDVPTVDKKDKEGGLLDSLLGWVLPLGRTLTGKIEPLLKVFDGLKDSLLALSGTVGAWASGLMAGGLGTLLGSAAAVAGIVGIGWEIYEAYKRIKEINQLNADTVKIAEKMLDDLNRRQFGNYSIMNTEDIEKQIDTLQQKADRTPEENKQLDELNYHRLQRKGLELDSEILLMKQEGIKASPNIGFGDRMRPNPEYEKQAQDFADKLKAMQDLRETYRKATNQYLQKHPIDFQSLQENPNNRITPDWEKYDMGKKRDVTPKETEKKNSNSVSLNAPTVNSANITNNATNTVVAMKRQMDTDYLMSALRTT